MTDPKIKEEGKEIKGKGSERGKDGGIHIVQRMPTHKKIEKKNWTKQILDGRRNVNSQYIRKDAGQGIADENHRKVLMHIHHSDQNRNIWSYPLWWGWREIRILGRSANYYNPFGNQFDTT